MTETSQLCYEIPNCIVSKHATTDPVKVVFGFNSRNKNHYGIMMYHRNRLIKPYERVGFQLRVGAVSSSKITHNLMCYRFLKNCYIF